MKMYFVLALLKIVSIRAMSTLPLFLLDNNNALSHLSISPNPFHKVSKASFSYIVRNAIEHSHTIVIFVEEELSMEDVTAKDNMGSPFFHMQQGLLGNAVKFMPKVELPYKVLTELLPRRQLNELYMTKKASNLQWFDKKNSYYYVFFESYMNVSRTEALREHDLIIREVYFYVRQMLPGPVIAFYTGIENPVKVERIRFVVPSPMSFEKPVTFVDGKKFSRIKLGGMYFEDKNGARHKVAKVIPRSHFDGSELLTSVINIVATHTDYNFTFRFRYDDRKWALARLFQNKYNDSFVDSVDTSHISAPWGESYLCRSAPIVIRNKYDQRYKSFTISQYQIQLLKQSFSYFGPAMTCPSDVSTTLILREVLIEPPPPLPITDYGPSKYFTIPIVTAMFLTSILLCILFVGIVILMGVNSNNKYDDSRGKPLMFTEG